MTQTLALLLDAYREMNARKMFWITLVLTGVVVLAFALFGVTDKGFTIFGATIPVVGARFWYKWVFSTFVIGIWAKWGALILALISTASVFPELIASGSIDLYLSKPISRLRLFFTKYAGGLLFVVLQTAVFAVGCYVVFGVRMGEWRPSLFLIVPLVVLLYSYLFCVCTLIGVMTRSTIAAILLTVLFWFLCFGVNSAEAGLFQYRIMQAAQARTYQREVLQTEEDIRRMRENPTAIDFLGIRESRAVRRRDDAQVKAAEAQKTTDKLALFHRFAYVVATIVPKTGETVDLLDRKLFNDADFEAMRKQAGNNNGFGEAGGPEIETASVAATNPAERAVRREEDAKDRALRRQAARESADEATRAAFTRSVPWIIGTSAAFEAVILAWAAWVFCRRDY